MTNTTRQQRRRELQEQTKTGLRLLGSGLRPQPKRDETLAVARVVASKLGEADNPLRARQAAQLAHRLCETSLSVHPPRRTVACRKGCAYCCHQFATATPPEVFLLAAAVRRGGRPGLGIPEVVARCAPLAGLAPADRLGRKLPCSLLVEGNCSVYPQRPLVCRQATSLDLDSCIEEFEGLDLDGQVEVSATHLAHAGTASVILLGAIRSHGLVDASVELAAGLAVVLGEPDCEQRWLAGEAVFAGIGVTASRPRDVDQIAGLIAAALV